MSSRSFSIIVCVLGLLLASTAAAQEAKKEAKQAPAAVEGGPAGAGAPASGTPAAPAPAQGAPGTPGEETEAGQTITSPPTAGSYMVQLKGLEQRVNELKERIFRSKARLNLLKETVLHGVIAGSRALIMHKNEMGSSFRLIKLVYAIDGAQIYAKADDTGTLDAKREFEIFNGSIVPGNHTISVLMIFRGHGYGIFSYLKGYKFTVRSSHTFTAGEGRQTVISVRAYEKGNVTTELKDRPAIKFDVNLYSTGVKTTGAEKGGSK